MLATVVDILDLPVPMAKKKTTTSFDFEKALANLEELVTAMEEGELSLEESLQAFEKGVKLTRECQSALDQAEQKVQLLVNADGATESLDNEEEQD